MTPQALSGLPAAGGHEARPVPPPRRLSALAALAAGALVLLLPAILHMPLASDSAVYNHVWTSQFADALGRGEVYPRWLPDSFQGYGAPVFYFYPPLSFYLSGALDLLGLSTDQAVTAAFGILLFGSGAAMHAWLRPRARRPLLWSLVYMAAPYHLTDVYSRGALAETGAFLWLPLIAMGVMNSRWRLLAISYAGLICTHLPTALLASLALIAPLAIARLRTPRAARANVAGVICGLLLSGIYLIPALSLQRHIAVDLLYLPYYLPQNWALWPSSGLVNPVLVEGLALTYGGVILALAVVRRSSWWSALALVSVLAGLGLLPVWNNPLLAKVQFPWRLFSVADFAAVSAFALGRPTRTPLAPLALAAALAVATPGALKLYTQNLMPFLKPFPAALIAAHDEAPEYLPRDVDAAGVTAGQRTPALDRFGGRPVTGLIVVDRTETVVLRRFHFPAWVVVRDGRAVATFPSGPGRLTSFAAAPGSYRLERRILPEELAGAASSLAGIILLCLGFGGRLRARARTVGAADETRPARAGQ